MAYRFGVHRVLTPPSGFVTLVNATFPFPETATPGVREITFPFQEDDGLIPLAPVLTTSGGAAPRHRERRARLRRELRLRPSP